MKNSRYFKPLSLFSILLLILQVSCSKEEVSDSPTPPANQVETDKFKHEFSFVLRYSDSTDYSNILESKFDYTLETEKEVSAANLRKILDDIKVPEVKSFLMTGASSKDKPVPVVGVSFSLKSSRNGEEIKETSYDLTPATNDVCTFNQQNYYFSVPSEETVTGMPADFQLGDFLEREYWEEFWEKTYETLKPVDSSNPVHAIRNSNLENAEFSFSAYCSEDSFNDGQNLKTTDLGFTLNDADGEVIGNLTIPLTIQKIDPILNLSVVKIQEQKKQEGGNPVNPESTVNFPNMENENIEIIRDHYKFQEVCPQKLFQAFFEIPNFPGAHEGIANSTMVDNPNNREFFVEIQGSHPMIWAYLDDTYVTSGATLISYQTFTGSNSVLGNSTTTPQGRLTFVYNCGNGGVPTGVDTEFTILIYQTEAAPYLEDTPGQEREKFFVRSIKVHLVLNLIG